MNKKILFLALAFALPFKASASSPAETELTFLRSSFFSHFNNERLTAVEYHSGTRTFLLMFGQRKAQVVVASLAESRISKLHTFCNQLTDPAIYANIEEFRNKAHQKPDLARTCQFSMDCEDSKCTIA